MAIFSKPVAAALLLALFVAAAWFGGPANAFEAGLMRDVAAIRSQWPRITGAVAGLTMLGGALVTLSLAAAAALWLLFRRAPARALILAVTVVLERLAVDGLKDWTGRARPAFEVDWLPHSLAYPSGHAANSMTAFLATALIAAPPELRRTAAIAAVMLSILVGLTRIYLGVHWPSDVIGGWAFGLLAVGAALILGRRSGALHLEPQHQIVGRHRPPLDEDQAA